MSFLRTLFRSGFRPPPAEKWDSIVSTMHFILSEERKCFFSACLDILETIPVPSIVNRTMTHSIELGIIVYQLHLARELIEAKQYVRPEDGSRFMNKLYGEALRYGSLAERDALMKSYWIVDDDRNGMLPFYGDLMTQITGRADILGVGILTQHTGVRLALFSRYSAAIAFGDKETAEKLRQSAQKMASASES